MEIGEGTEPPQADDGPNVPVDAPPLPLVESRGDAVFPDSYELFQSVTRHTMAETRAEDDQVVLSHQGWPVIGAIENEIVSSSLPPLAKDDFRVDAMEVSAPLLLQNAKGTDEEDSALPSASPPSPPKQSSAPGLPGGLRSPGPHVSSDGRDGDETGTSGAQRAFAAHATVDAAVDEPDATMAVDSASLPMVASDTVNLQDQPSKSPVQGRACSALSPSSNEMGAELATLAEDTVPVAEERTSSPADNRGLVFTTAASSALVDENRTLLQDKDNAERQVNEGSSIETPARPPSPVAPTGVRPNDTAAPGADDLTIVRTVDSMMAGADDLTDARPEDGMASREGGSLLNAGQPSSGTCEVPSSHERLEFHGVENSPAVNDAQPASVALFSKMDAENDTMITQQSAKRRRTCADEPAKPNGIIYSGKDAVSVLLGQTAEKVLILAGMAQMRAGRIPTTYERELARSAYQNMNILVSRAPPKNLVARDAVESLLHELDTKRIAQKMRQDQAWADAVAEAEAFANARAEAFARAKAEAVARAQAEADELERRRQMVLKATNVGANGPVVPSPGASPLSPGQSSYTPSLGFPVSGTLPSSQIQPSQAMMPASTANEVPRLVTPEKVTSINGPSQNPVPNKPLVGRPPKSRNKLRKESSTVTLFTPGFLSDAQNQAPDPQKVQLTHSQLCIGVQQFIREHVPPVSQDRQALSPVYISTHFPCQICKLTVEDTGGALVCDSCDEVSHLKCIHPPPSKAVAKGDWFCRKCLTASRGGKYPSKYGPLVRGSQNSVKLWPPHDASNASSLPVAIGVVANGSVGGEGASAPADVRKLTYGPAKGQRRASLEINTDATHESNDDPGVGNFGSSPHLIVHLVNEPSPRTADSSNPSHLLKGDNQRLSSSGQSQSQSAMQEPPGPEKAASLQQGGAVKMKTPVQGGLGMMTPSQMDGGRVSEAERRNGGLNVSNIQSVPVDVVNDRASEKNGQGTPAHVGKPEARAQTTESRKANSNQGTNLSGRQGDVPLPIVMEWVGGSIRKAEGKVYYRACRVGGITFSVSDCALFRPETPGVPPYIARLQVLWEDTSTSHKWVRVSWCYYPSDIPLTMGRPGTTAQDEVYESNHCDNNLLGSIQGPCFVLAPFKFREETERRNNLKRSGSSVEDLPPIFLSRWMYDAPKGMFRPLQE